MCNAKSILVLIGREKVVAPPGYRGQHLYTNGLPHGLVLRDLPNGLPPVRDV